MGGGLRFETHIHTRQKGEQKGEYGYGESYMPMDMASYEPWEYGVEKQSRMESWRHLLQGGSVLSK